MLVLDEADTMLDMGFIRDIQKIIDMLPKQRQTLFFSATMPPNIVRLANDILTNPVRVEVARESSAAETVEQTIYSVRQNDKRELLVEILKRPEVESALVFTRTKYGADKVAKYLSKAGVHSEAIHGNKSQPQRDRAMNGFKKGKFRVLIATDIASRGIDVDDLSHVINFELPNISESYVHRIGRTGRAGASGQAISFCNEGEERKYLRDIQRLIQKEIHLETSHEWHLNMPPVGTESHPASKGGRKSGGGKSGGRNGGGGGGNYGYGGYKGTSSDGRRDRPGGGRPSGNGRKPQRSEGGRSGATGRPSSNGGAPKRWDNNRSESNAPRRDQPARSGGRSNDGRSSRSGDGRPQRSHDRRPARSNDGRSPRSSEGSSNSSSDNRRPNKSSFKPAEPTKARKSFGGFFGFGKEDS
jgi:ATP-dependent RNA helicase RhlE